MVIGIGVLIFIICISIGWYKNISEIKRLEEVGVPVDAIVTDSWSETTSHKSKSTDTLTHTTSYYASVQYEYNGAVYSNPKISLGRKQISMGKKVSMLVDPDDPSISIYPDSSDGSLFSIIVFAVGGIFGFYFAFMGLKLYRGKVTIGPKGFQKVSP